MCVHWKHRITEVLGQPLFQRFLCGEVQIYHWKKFIIYLPLGGIHYQRFHCRWKVYSCSILVSQSEITCINDDVPATYRNVLRYVDGQLCIFLHNWSSSATPTYDYVWLYVRKCVDRKKVLMQTPQCRNDIPPPVS